MERLQYGYVRVSCKDQNEIRQTISLSQFGIKADYIYMDKMSGKNFERPQYSLLIHHLLKKGDLLVVTSLDRLGRNYTEILEEWRFITKELQADIKILDMPLLDTRPERDLVNTLITDIVLQLLSFVAESERDNIRKRQAEGIAAARERGVHLGHPTNPIPDTFPSIYFRWKERKISAKQAQEMCRLSKQAFYRLVHKYEKELQEKSSARNERNLSD